MNDWTKSLLTRTALASGAAFLLLTAPGAASAQDSSVKPTANPNNDADAGAATSENDAGELVVTARKREEDILKTPISVTAITGKDIAARNIITVRDLAANTPGLNINNSNSGRQDRSFQSFIVRGITPGTINLTTASVFIDGVPVVSTTALQTITDPERVEVLKGPQSAYFGRQTFAGAVNVVTRNPTDHLSGTLNAQIAEHFFYDLGATLSGPLAGDALGFTASVRRYSKDGSYRNAADPSQTLGDQSTFSANLGLVAKPTDNLKIKVLGIYVKDHDGPSADGLIAANTFTSGGRTIVQSQANCTFDSYSTQTGNFPTVTSRPRLSQLGRAPTPAICGRAPKLLPGSLAANTTEDPAIKAFLANPAGRIVNPDDGVQGYGLRRAYYHGHIAIDYEVPGTGIVLSSLTGYNNEYYSELDDLDNYDGRTVAFASPVRSYYDFPFLIERTSRDFSQELRATSPQDKPFRWTIGGSYLHSRIQNDGGGGAGVLVSTISGKNVSETIGGFFGLTYEPVTNLTLSVEGRYQIDKISTYAGPTQTTILNPDTGAAVPANGKIVERTFKNFVPRAIVQYQATPDLMIYASYARGINPAQFNNSIYLLPAAQQAIAAQAGIGVLTRPEKLDNYEVGIKGKLLDGRLRFALSAYYADWKDQLTTTNVNFIVPDANGVLTPRIISGLLNNSATKLKGVELETTFTPIDGLDLNASGAINDTSIRKYDSYPFSTLYGNANYRGNELPNTSKYSASVGGQYTSKIGGRDNLSAYVRSDFYYKSGLFSNAANVVKTAPQKIANFKVGVNFGPATLEGFVNNAFNNKAYTSISDNYVFTPTFAFFTYNSALNVGLPDLRTFGIRGRFRF